MRKIQKPPKKGTITEKQARDAVRQVADENECLKIARKFIKENIELLKRMAKT